MARSIAKEIKDLEILIGKLAIGDNKFKERLNHTQMHILMYLIKHQNEEVCQKDLEKETHLKKASITGTLNSLEDKEIIVRKQSDDDKRKNIITLSEKALSIKEKIEERYKKIEKQINENITEDELNSFFIVIDKMKKNLNGDCR